jgi:hypothetical protein
MRVGLVYASVKLDTNISIALPLDTDEAHAAMRHVHELDLNNNYVVLAVPTNMSSYAKFVPCLQHNLVHEVISAADCLFVSSDLSPSTSKARYYVITLDSDHAGNSSLCLATQRLPRMNLAASIPTEFAGACAHTLIDTYSTHSMVNSQFLSSNIIQFTAATCASTGVNNSVSHCLGYVTLPLRVGSNRAHVKFTVEHSLPSASWDQPNNALLSTEVFTACCLSTIGSQGRITIRINRCHVSNRSVQKRKPFIDYILPFIPVDSPEPTSLSSNIADFY